MEAFLEEFHHLKIQLEEIKLATDNFANNNVIGRGGFGKVYKGVLSHSKGISMVALKRLDRDHGQGDPEFWKEILMLSRYTHENLVSLLGFCNEGDEKILVYEYASRGSLDHHLSSSTLTWRQRLKICISAAKGLSYLHNPQRTQQRVLHRDIKSSNILLDENWNAKVSDMGLSKFGPANQKHTFIVSIVVGTLGYIDPMYMQTSILTKESDVYSFGVVLFEVLCGRLCYENKNGHIQTLGKTWKKSYKAKKLNEVIFEDLKQHMDHSSLKTFSDIAYQCLKKARDKRPHMHHVVEKLEIALSFQYIFEENHQLMTLLPYEITAKEINKFYNIRDICMWKYPKYTVFFHAFFIILLVYSPDQLILTMNQKILTFVILKFFFPPTYRFHNNVRISFADRVRSVAEGILTEMGGILNYWEWIRLLLISGMFTGFCLVVVIIFMVIPLKMSVALIGVFLMRHPIFRNRLPSVSVNFF